MESHLAEIYVPSPGGKHFTKKGMHELTSSDFEKIHSQPTYEAALLEAIGRFQMTIFAFQQQDSIESDSEKSSRIQGTISAIHDYLIDEVNISMVPTVCGLIDDLKIDGIPDTNPDLIFFKGVILYNPNFLREVPVSYLGILTGDVKVTDYKKFGLDLIKRAEQTGCSDATEYLRNMRKK
jgi:hypothetical protein